MKILIVMMIIAMMVILSSCARMENEWSYFKDEYGNCYASLGREGSQSFAFTSIPCENMPK